MTNREFYANVIASETMSDEMKQFAAEAIAKLDERNAKRAATPTKTQKENEPIIKAIAEVLTNEPMLSSDIASKLNLSVSKVSALVKKVDGVQAVDVKVKGKGVRKAYFL